MSNLNELSAADLEDFLTFVNAKYEHYQRLLQKIRKAMAAQGQQEISFTPSSEAPRTQNGLRDKIATLLDQESRWMSNGEIRDLLKSKYGIELKSVKLRRELNNGKNVIFEQTGEARYSRWRLLRKNDEQK
ncbi:MAG: hypothetical protein KKG33_04400 [candidate division Zixibacteria bacterium]|nr:hypothetical protein [candidate division Zixibacteria bacterium]MBU1470309.1 hypothetical protein [candidate division Zixibacteria bacterium]MBU2624782.1 hypothetical protein [candidate division Zixibacteria bacterium]